MRYTELVEYGVGNRKGNIIKLEDYKFKRVDHVS